MSRWRVRLENEDLPYLDENDEPVGKGVHYREVTLEADSKAEAEIIAFDREGGDGYEVVSSEKLKT